MEERRVQRNRYRIPGQEEWGKLRQESQDQATQCEWFAAGLQITNHYLPSPRSQGRSESKELKTSQRRERRREGGRGEGKGRGEGEGGRALLLPKQRSQSLGALSRIE